MAFTYKSWLNSLPFRGQSQAYAQDPSLVPSYADEMQFAGNLGTAGAVAINAGLPVVINNPQYIPEFIDFAEGYGNYMDALGATNTYLTGANFLGQNGASYWGSTLGPGTMAGTAFDGYTSSLVPYLGLGRGVNMMTANVENPYGTIPILSGLQKGVDNVVQGMNNTRIGRGLQSFGAGLYDNSVGRLYDMETGLFRGLGNLSQIPGETIGGIGDFLREGYQFIDKELFGSALPGGAIAGDKTNFTKDKWAQVEEANSWQNPFKGLTDLISGATDSFRSKASVMYDDYFSITEKALVDRFVDKGFSKKDAVEIVMAEGSNYSNAGDFIDDWQSGKAYKTEYSDAQMKELGKYLGSAINDPELNPFLENELNQMMMDKYGTDIEFDDDYFLKIGPDAIAGDLKDAYKDVHLEVANKYGNETAKDLLGKNALSDDVLNFINSGIDPDASIADTEKYIDITYEGYDPVAIELTEQERYNIARQNDYDIKEYNDHIQWLDTQQMKEVSNRVNELIGIGVNMSNQQIAELSQLAIRQQEYATNASVSAEVGNFVDDLYGEANNAIQKARNEQARVAKEQAEATQKALEKAKAEKLEAQKNAERQRQAEEARKAEQAKQAQKEAQRIQASQRASEQAAMRAAQEAQRQTQQLNLYRDYGSVQTYYDCNAGSQRISGGYLICWVAREVYGSDNPKWLQFRDWMINDAPSDVRESYIEHGPALAEYISDKPKLKDKIKTFMDSKIGEF